MTRKYERKNAGTVMGEGKRTNQAWPPLRVIAATGTYSKISQQVRIIYLTCHAPHRSFHSAPSSFRRLYLCSNQFKGRTVRASADINLQVAFGPSPGTKPTSSRQAAPVATSVLSVVLRGSESCVQILKYDTCGLHVSGGVLEALLGFPQSDPQYLL
jgi:hypothetical protein